MEITSEFFESLKKQTLFKGTIVTGSMVPVINVGDKIVADVLSKDLKRFDIIVFKQGNRLICHYLWTINRQVEPYLMQTRSMVGGVDLPIRPEDYLGKVISHHLSFWQKLKILFKQ